MWEKKHRKEMTMMIIQDNPEIGPSSPPSVDVGADTAMPHPRLRPRPPLLPLALPPAATIPLECTIAYVPVD